MGESSRQVGVRFPRSVPDFDNVSECGVITSGSVVSLVGGEVGVSRCAGRAMEKRGLGVIHPSESIADGGGTLFPPSVIVPSLVLR